MKGSELDFGRQAWVRKVSKFGYSGFGPGFGIFLAFQLIHSGVEVEKWFNKDKCEKGNKIVSICQAPKGCNFIASQLLKQHLK